MKNRLIKEIKLYAVIVLIGIAYLIFVIKTGIMLPCLFRMKTQLLCPGCGITHMVTALARLDFKGAYEANEALFITLPFVFAVLIYEEIRYIKTGERRMRRFSAAFLGAEIVILILYGIIRNLK
ncbi:MAG: DUF2752 domain-containing protein [Clostridia bacterium]|nr:DUF2752 domain-containing protein [Clostridia bacterium]